MAAALVLWGLWAAAGVHLGIAQGLALPRAVHLGPGAVVLVQLGPCVATVVQLTVVGVQVHPGAGAVVQVGPVATSSLLTTFSFCSCSYSLRCEESL